MREVAAGRAQFCDLTDQERPTAHALIDADISERVAATEFGRSVRCEGVTTVSLDEDSNLIETAPDGTATLL